MAGETPLRFSRERCRRGRRRPAARQALTCKGSRRGTASLRPRARVGFSYQNFSLASNERLRTGFRRTLLVVAFCELLLRAMCCSSALVSPLDTGGAASGDEMPNEGDKSDDEEEVNQASRHVKHNEAQQPGDDENDCLC